MTADGELTFVQHPSASLAPGFRRRRNRRSRQRIPPSPASRRRRRRSRRHDANPQGRRRGAEQRLGHYRPTGATLEVVMGRLEVLVWTVWIKSKSSISRPGSGVQSAASGGMPEEAPTVRSRSPASLVPTGNPGMVRRAALSGAPRCSVPSVAGTRDSHGKDTDFWGTRP